jgi:riboflavin synthase
VAKCDNSRFTADVLRETESRTGLAELKPGDKVNLERALKAGARLGGHIVQGHVDGRGELVAKISKGRDFALEFKCGRLIAAGCVLKGSIAINGVSLTVSAVAEDRVRVDVIPTTLRETNLGLLRIGDKVNLETDVLGKYARGRNESPSGGEECSGASLTMEMLIENGFA